jgi:hypothetical protein
VAGKLKEADPHAAEILSRLRVAIGKTTDPDQLSALAQAYVAVAGKVKETDPHAAEELAGLREAIGKTTNPRLRSALAQAYAAVAKRRAQQLRRCRTSPFCSKRSGACGVLIRVRRSLLLFWQLCDH